MELGISRERLDSHILAREQDALRDFEDARRNARIYADLSTNLATLVQLYAWADAEPARVFNALSQWHQAYRELLLEHDERDPSDPRDPTDRSLVSSCATLQVLSGAWVIGAKDIVSKLAPAIWDPAGATYINPQSESCRPDQQQFAYSVRECITGSTDKALERCRAVNPLDNEVGAWTTIFNGILHETGARIPGALQVMLTAHEREASRKMYPFNVEYGVCLVALGLVAVALRKGLVRLGELPESQFLPYKWIQL